MTGLESSDGVSVDLLVGSDGSSLGSVHGGSGSVVSSDTGGVLGLGSSSGGVSSGHGLDSFVVSVNGFDVVSDGRGVSSLGRGVRFLGTGGVGLGVSVHFLGVSGGSLGVSKLVGVVLDPFLSLELLGVPVVHDSDPVGVLRLSSIEVLAGSSAGSLSSGVVSLGLSGGLHGADMGSDSSLEGFGPAYELGVLAGSPCFAAEVVHGVVVPAHNELLHLSHVSGSGLLSGVEVLGGVQPGETVIGLGHGGDSGEDGDFSEHW